MSDCLLRISEAVGVDIADVDSVLTIHRSKTDSEARGFPLYIGAPTRQVITSLAAGYRFKARETLSSTGRGKLGLKVSSLAILSVWVLLYRLLKLGHLLWICRLQDDGNHFRCQRITHVQSWQAGAELHASNMENVKVSEADTYLHTTYL